MNRTCVIYSPRYLDHDTGTYHPESPSRLTRLLEELRRSNVFKEGVCELREPRRALQEEITLVHEKEYYMKVKKIADAGFGALDPDTPVSKGSFEAAVMAAGGVLKACELIMAGEFKNGFALVRPPGHHAGVRGRALGAPTAGFCIFNNVAVAAQSLLKHRSAQRVLVLDLDCHHGNGTQEIFNESEEVMYVSLHQDGKTLYPGTGSLNDIGVGEGEGYKINIPLPPGSCDDVHLMAFEEILVKISSQFKPDFILVSAGFDSHHEDPLTNMGVSIEGFRRMYLEALNMAEELCQGRLVASLEGGYGVKFASSAATAIRVLAGLPVKPVEEFKYSDPGIVEEVKSTLNALKNLLSSYWSL
ncbi:MAG: histone deacetylase [Candidatus Bathyarchaeia archaeon]